MKPRTIQIFLPSGDPSGIRVAELTTSIVRVVEVPRSMLLQFMKMPEASQVGVYLLVGDNDDQETLAAYVGQTGALGTRIGEHHKDPKKDFWNRVFVIVSHTNSLTQTHALFLEWCSIKHINEAVRYKSKNGNAGSKPHTPAPLEADFFDVFDTARMLLSTLGQPLFEPIAKAKETLSTEDVFYFRGANYEATGEYTAEGFVVLKGGKARKEIAQSLANTSFVKRRKALLDDGSLADVEGQLVFQRDVLFKTPSGASDIVPGMSTNGWAVWKTKAGKTLDELKRQPLD